MSDKTRHPMQPVEWDGQGVVRFKGNAIVRYLLDNNGQGGRIDLNTLSRMNFSQDDWTHFAQLIGYSVSGWGDLSYVSPLDCNAADYEVECLLKEVPVDPGLAKAKRST